MFVWRGGGCHLAEAGTPYQYRLWCYSVPYFFYVWGEVTPLSVKPHRHVGGRPMPT